ncbi:hypothetical protein TRAPUB_7343 [Trametes pubescens]|uniref:FAD/NAD(P)-binding domain-containing protein n=1 Tax=Trametes pubescens TaxID=154538 RepID=A0A1M2W6S5_TRAPU|nr:hypothetical protein TRAPUB_7343 [Trametes pubescens]
MKRSSRRISSATAAATGLCAFILLSSLAFCSGLWTRYKYTLSRQDKGGMYPGASPVWDVGTLPDVSMYFEPTIHYQLNSTEADAEWAALVPTNGGIVHVGPERQPFMLSVFHQLRCLDILRRAYISHAEEPDAVAVHCLNYIRQMVLCRRDTILEPVVDIGSAHAVQAWRTLTCKDWRKVYEAHAQQGTSDPRSEPVAIVGSGVAGLITAYTLLRDGFTDVKILTRDLRVGGVWATNRIYPGLYLNKYETFFLSVIFRLRLIDSVHGEYRLSPLEMPAPSSADGRLSGDDMAQYMARFTDMYLQDRIEFGLDISNIRRGSNGQGWLLDVRNVHAGEQETRSFTRMVVCTGGCDVPKLPANLHADKALATGFKGLVFHSVDFGPKLQDLTASVPLQDTEGSSSLGSSIVVIGGGKSAQDIAAYLANEGRAVTVVCPNLDAFTAGPKPLPDFIRKSRLLSLFSPHIHLRTKLERFLHTTWVGQKTVEFMWNGLVDSSFKAVNVPEDSPLRNTVSPFWHIRINDEGVPRNNGFHALALARKINVITPAHAVGFSEDGQSVTLDDGRSIRASAVVLATGYQSSWSSLFEADTAEELGLNPHPAETSSDYHWDYTSLSNPPPLHPYAKKWSSSIYRGLVPSKNIARRDFAVNGACVSPNNGYTLEVASHWISSYFLGDPMRLPETPEAALAETDRAAAWLRTRYPEVPTALNSSQTGYLAFWTWPQHVDDLLEDMGLAVMRSGGNGLTWPFKVIDLKEIAHLKEERDAKRPARNAA